MTRARDMANLGSQAGSGLDASDITTGTLGNTVQDNVTRLGTVTVGTYNGVLGDSYTASDKYYLHAKAGVFTLSGGSEMINTTGSTQPFWTYTGDTTNIVGVNNHDIKFVKAGVYYINYSVTFRYSGTSYSRYIGAFIRGSGNTSESSAELAGNYDQIANVHSSTDYGGVSCSFVGAFSANDLINFFVAADDSNAPDLWRDTHMSIFLVRPT